MVSAHIGGHDAHEDWGSPDPQFQFANRLLFDAQSLPLFMPSAEPGPSASNSAVCWPRITRIRERNGSARSNAASRTARLPPLSLAVPSGLAIAQSRLRPAGVVTTPQRIRRFSSASSMTNRAASRTSSELASRTGIFPLSAL
jgi:hypothetical protein